MARSSLIERLRERIRAIEQVPVSLAAPPVVDAGAAHTPACNSFAPAAISASPPPQEDHAASWTFGIPDIDQILPGGGLEAGGLHEILPARYPDSWAALGFALALVARRRITAGRPSIILWALTEHERREAGAPYAPGLGRFGIDPADLLLVRARRTAELAWALEEGLKSRALCAVLGQGEALRGIQARRLMLAARTHRTPCLFVSGAGTGSGSALTRWRVAAAPSEPPSFDAGAPGNPCWSLTLERCRHGPQNRGWIVEWEYQDHETYRFRLASPMADRPADVGSGTGAPTAAAG